MVKERLEVQEENNYELIIYKLRMKEKIENLIKNVLKNLEIEIEDFSVLHPDDLKNGDYYSNVAMICAKNMGKNPKELAEKIVTELLARHLARQDLAIIEKVEVAGPGFINFYLSREFFTESIKEVLKEKEHFRAINDPILMRRYERRRAGDIEALLALTHRLHQLFLNPTPPMRWFRNTGMRLLNQHDVLKRLLIARALG